MNITYGIEIEGLFERRFAVKNKKFIDDIKTDCSVHSGDIRYANRTKMKNVMEETEIASKKLSFDDACDYLSELSSGRNRYYDDSCGLHLHVGTDNNNASIANVAWNYKLISKMQKLKYCIHATDRIHNSKWCNPYRTKKQLVDERGEKYRFVRYHSEYNTLEFRFLAPCSHAKKNILMLLAELQKYLNASEHMSNDKIEIDTDEMKNKKEKYTYNHDLKQIKKLVMEL